jgi:hypothetical protein
MDEEQLFSWRSMRSWRDGDFEDSQDALALSPKLWGDLENLRRQLLASSPEIPPGLSLSGLRSLLGIATVGLQFGEQMPVPGVPNGTRIVVGAQQFSVHEARYEIVRRAIAAMGGS